MPHQEPSQHDHGEPLSGRIREDAKSAERAWTLILVGLVLLVGILSYVWLGPAAVPSRPTSAVAELSPSRVPLVTGSEPIEQLFIKAGCPVCHFIPGIPGAQGRVGPSLVLGSTGPTRLADPRYQGKGKTVREYVIESILDPGAYVVPGYPDRAMPRWYGQKLSAEALDKMAVYLEQLTDQPESPRR